MQLYRKSRAKPGMCSDVQGGVLLKVQRRMNLGRKRNATEETTTPEAPGVRGKNCKKSTEVE